ncbi:putative transposase [Actinoplanes missouriensis 431]|uniref:Putative transposase n=2 Tax=Actinoplanes missouriensis TaxID=1866 RepID=I0HAN0_ACTM4|nr:putative transposase [Actinoplanes missouriensis 431]
MARAAFRKGNLATRIRDELGQVYEDGRFVAVFGVRGRPGISPAQLMIVSVLQFAEDLTDRQAAEAVRDRITWKYALGWSWTIRGSMPVCSVSSGRGWSMVS